jgi:GR25 family glycosyltransferase involved in LPS biosynthesis
MNELDADPTVGQIPYWFRTERLDSLAALRSELTFDRAHGIAKALVLNLDRQPARWDRFVEMVEHVRLGHGSSLRDLCERVSAVDGLTTPLGEFSADVARTYTLADFYSVDPQPFLDHLVNRDGIVIQTSPQELAVAESHLRVWRRVAAGEEVVLVMEDDAEFGPHFAADLDTLWDELLDVTPDGYDLLYLSYRPVDSGVRGQLCSPSLLRPTGGLWWLSGYVLTPRGAARLLAALPIKGPVDQWVNQQFRRLQVFAASEPLIGQAKQIESDNSYSIIPVLRTARGSRHKALVRSHGTGPDHEAPELSIEAPRKLPVFGIGLNKTGTTSLHEALTLLGYRSCHWQSDDFSSQVSALIDEGSPLPFEALTDVASVVERFKDLDRLYPTAVFILTTRELDDWLKSRVRHVALNRADVAAGAARHSWTTIDLATWRTERLMHHEAVFTHFKDRPDKLLVMDICGGDGWERLCGFLNCPIPSVPFPSVDPLSGRPHHHAAVSGSVVVRECEVDELKHDDFPWIAKPHVRPSPPNAGTARAVSEHVGGTFQPLLLDDLTDVDERRWVKLSDTFDTNLAVFRPANVSPLEGGGVRLAVESERCGDRAYTAGALASPIESERLFHYGRFEAEIKPAAVEGLLSGMFLYRRDPWQEIDLEFLGARPSKLLANVYYNPGDKGDTYNYGMRGTPVLVDLGFDASDDFHRYAIEWDPLGVRWYVDGEVVYARGQNPTPVPHLPMRLYYNTWPIDAVELAGSLRTSDLPASTSVRSVRILMWIPPLGN